jgi:hypothetical protein
MEFGGKGGASVVFVHGGMASGFSPVLFVES